MIVTIEISNYISVSGTLVRNLENGFAIVWEGNKAYVGKLLKKTSKKD